MGHMEMGLYKTDPCILYKWVDGEILLIMLWVDNFCIMGSDPAVMEHNDKLMSLLNCNDVGEMDEYVGCHLERD